MRPQPAIKGILALMVLLCSACGMSESDVATAIAETEQARAFEALVQTATAAAQATETPVQTATSPATATPSWTVTPPPGMGYVPDFLGMDLAEAERLLTELDFRYIWVALIDRDVPEWQVCEQSPDPGSLIDLDAERVRIVVAVYRFTPTSPGGGGGGGSCGLPAGGSCTGTVRSWCEGATVMQEDCNVVCPYGGFCDDPSVGPAVCICYY